MHTRDISALLFGQGRPPADPSHRFDIHLPGLAEAPSEPTHAGVFEQHWLRTLAHVLVEEVQELHCVEQLQNDHLGPAAVAATEPILRYLYQMHARQTRDHLQKLDQVHQMLGLSPDGRVNLDMEGLIIGMKETIKENAPGRARDLSLLAATLKIKQREVTGYCNARDYAQLLGLEPVAAVLQATLNEETALLERFTALNTLLTPHTNGHVYN